MSKSVSFTNSKTNLSVTNQAKSQASDSYRNILNNTASSIQNQKSNKMTTSSSRLFPDVPGQIGQPKNKILTIRVGPEYVGHTTQKVGLTKMEKPRSILKRTLNQNQQDDLDVSGMLMKPEP